MHLSAHASYEAGPDRVATMFADPDFVEAKVRATGAVSQTCDVVGTADGAFTVTTRRQMPSTDVPAQFRTIVGGTFEVREIEAWQPGDAGGRHGTLVVEVTGAPVRLTGTMRLTGTPDGTTTLTVDADVRATIPFFGGAVEKAIVGAITGVVSAEERAGADWLAR